MQMLLSSEKAGKIVLVPQEKSCGRKVSTISYIQYTARQEFVVPVMIIWILCFTTTTNIYIYILLSSKLILFYVTHAYIYPGIAIISLSHGKNYFFTIIILQRELFIYQFT